MKVVTQWKQKMFFVADAEGHSVPMDAKAPIGTNEAATPKELLLAAVCGCSGMDVAGLLKKHKQPVDELTIEAEAKNREGFPATFAELTLTFRLSGAIDRAVLVEAVRLSQSKYCSVSAMLSKAVPVSYKTILNSELVDSGLANFE